MKRWCIAVVLIAALLLVGAAGAVKPVKEPVDKVVFVHYKDAAVKAAPGADAVATYKLMGVKWATFPVPYNVYTANPYVPETLVTTEVREAFSAWDEATTKGLFSFGVSASPAPLNAGGNGKNDVYFAPIAETNVIAVTTVWYTRLSKRIVEADMQLNTKLPWGIDADDEGVQSTLTGAYDIRNIATHEAGHVCGLADLYTPRSSELTMYGYGGLGEVRKDSLAAGDIAGLVKLYGT